MKTRFGTFQPVLLASLLALVAVPAASGQIVLFTNVTPETGTINGQSINLGYSVTDSFTLTNTSTISEITFLAETDQGDTVNSVNWAITDSPFAGPIEESGTAYTLPNTYEGTSDPFGPTYDFLQESFSISPYVLAAGTTYYLELGTAVPSKLDGAVYWDESDGSSTASLSPGGTIGSESYQILGKVGGTPSGIPGDPGTPATDVPEGGSYSYLLLSGVVILASGLFRRRQPGK